jgi:hypothetical protein
MSSSRQPQINVADPLCRSAIPRRIGSPLALLELLTLLPVVLLATLWLGHHITVLASEPPTHGFTNTEHA